MDFVTQATAFVVLLGGILGLFLKLRGVEKEMENTIDKKIGEKISEQDKLQVERDKLSDNKLDTLWRKLNSVDTQINGNPDNDTKGLIITVAMLKMMAEKGGEHED